MMNLTVVPAAVVFARAAEVVVSRRAVLKGGAVVDLLGLQGTYFVSTFVAFRVCRPLRCSHSHKAVFKGMSGKETLT